MRLNISSILFLAAFLVYILSSYGIGKVESNDDKSLKDLAIIGLGVSSALMFVVWLFNWGIQTPYYSERPVALPQSSNFK
jgi:hypothetical protein